MASFPINAFPRGFNKLFGLDSKGQNPNKLEDTIQPTVDLERFVMSNKPLSTGTANFTCDNTNQLQFVAASAITVPETELWYVIGQTAFHNSQFSGEFSGALGISNALGSPGAKCLFAFRHHERQDIQNNTFGYQTNYLLPAPAGTTFSYYNGRCDTAVAQDWDHFVMFYRLSQ
jgi:hypothetical protein